jgi:hypothetical protein
LWHRFGGRGLEVQLYPFFNPWRWVVSVTSQLLYTRESALAPIVQEAEWASGLVLMGVENFATTRVQIPNHPAHMESLAQL